MKVKRLLKRMIPMYKATGLFDSDMPPIVYKIYQYESCGVWVHQRGGELDWIEAIADTKEGAVEAVERWRR